MLGGVIDSQARHADIAHKQAEGGVAVASTACLRRHRCTTCCLPQRRAPLDGAAKLGALAVQVAHVEVGLGVRRGWSTGIRCGRRGIELPHARPSALLLFLHSAPQPPCLNPKAAPPLPHLQVLRRALDGVLEALFGVLHVALQTIKEGHHDMWDQLPNTSHGSHRHTTLQWCDPRLSRTMGCSSCCRAAWRGSLAASRKLTCAQ